MAVAKVLRVRDLVHRERDAAVHSEMRPLKRGLRQDAVALEAESPAGSLELVEAVADVKVEPASAKIVRP